MLELNQWGVPIGWRQAVGNPLFVNQFKFGFLNCRPKCTKGQLCPSPIMLWLSCLQWTQCRHSIGRGACSIVWSNVCCWHHPLLLSGESRRGVVPAKMACVRMDVSGDSHSCDFSSVFLNTLCYASGTLEWGIIPFLFSSYLDHFHSPSSSFFSPSGLWLIPFESF